MIGRKIGRWTLYEIAGRGAGVMALAGMKLACPVCVVLSVFLLVALVPSGSTGQTTPCRAPNKMYEGQCLHPQQIAKLKRERARRHAEAARKEAEQQAEAARKEAGMAAAEEIQWVRIPGGTFRMGSNEGADDEKPVHSVTVSTFEIAATEVTVGQYRKCFDVGVCSAPVNYSSYCNWGKSDRADHPVNCVDWDQATAYAKWVGGRLPTEAEWEYAARSGGRDQKYPWGNQTATCSYAVMSEGSYGCGRDSTGPVCSKTAGNTVQGLCDMAGNVWEWVQDEGHRDYTGAPSNGSAWEGAGSGRVLRGGSFFNDAKYVRAAIRYSTGHGSRGNPHGFRPARSVR